MTERLGPNEQRGICPFCGSAISTVVRDGLAYARCSHRGCGARGPLMQCERRACEVFASPPPTARQRQHHTELVDAMRDALAKLVDAETALGRAWMHGGVSLAEGIRRKTTAMERLSGVHDGGAR